MLSFFPYARISQVPVNQVVDAIHYLFFRWGFVPTFRADNGAPFGDPSRQSISPLNLYLIGLGIRVKLNPPRSPIKNAKVERNQGTTSRWACPSLCSNYVQLQQKLDEVMVDQRQNYPTKTCQGKTRAEKYPALLNNPQRFHPNDFQVQRVYQFLSKGSWKRKVSAQGVVSILGCDLQVGFKHRATTVTATFDPITVQWIFKNDRGDLLKSCNPPNLDEKTILSFSSKCQRTSGNL